LRASQEVRLRPVPPAARSTYHHGSLRDALVDACVAVIEAEGIGAVSLRRVAREAGVTSAAPYHHFADRSALLAAIAVHGSQSLEARLREAVAGATDAVRALGLVIETYVEFASVHPGYVHVMLRPELYEPEKHPDAARAGEGSIMLLTDIVVACQREGSAPPGDPDTLVGLVWALCVGIVTLWLDGPLEQRCVTLGTTPQELTTRIATLLEALLGAGRPTIQRGSSPRRSARRS
jgi:AcrR family transcriptional regulator